MIRSNPITRLEAGSPDGKPLPDWPVSRVAEGILEKPLHRGRGPVEYMEYAYLDKTPPT